MGTENIYQFLVTPVCDQGLVETLKECIINGELIYSKLIEKSLSVQIIENGIELLKKQNDIPEGKPVNELNGDEVNIGSEFYINKFGNNLTHISSGSYLVSKSEGVFIIDNGIPEVLKLNQDAYFNVRISDDYMQALIDFYPAAPGGKQILLKEVFASLREMQIEATINTYEIESCLTVLEENALPIYDVIVAEGKKPINGKDAEIINYIHIKKDFSPKIGEDGRIDFKSLDILNPVSVDQPIALYVDSEDGKDGYDIYGNTIEARFAKKIKFPGGRNTYLHPHKPGLIVSKIDGNLIEKNGVFSVSEVMNIDGNIDYKTGNINTRSSIKICGDVKSSFRVDADHNIEVIGCVEDAVIKAGGNVLVKSGFLGTGNGAIYSDGNVDLRYVRNQKVLSRGSIFVQNEVFEASIYAKNRIIVGGGKNMSILGGYAIAGNTIEVNCLGNEYGIETIVEAGYDYELDNKIRKRNIEIQGFEKALSSISQSFDNICRTLSITQEQKETLRLFTNQKIAVRLSPDDFPNFEKQLTKIDDGLGLILKSTNITQDRFHTFFNLLEQKISFKHAIKKLRKMIKEIEVARRKPTGARIKVNRRIYPNVSILINKRRFNVKEELLNKMFMLSKEKDEIIIL